MSNLAPDRRQTFVERLAMYRWKPQEVLENPASGECVAMLFSDPSPSAGMYEWLAWYATEKANAIRAADDAVQAQG